MSPLAQAGASVALDALGALVRSAPEIIELVTGQDRLTLEQRIERAREAIKDPGDPSADDAARRAELERIIRGEG